LSCSRRHGRQKAVLLFESRDLKLGGLPAALELPSVERGGLALCDRAFHA
jgi:hypothetical protein